MGPIAIAGIMAAGVIFLIAIVVLGLILDKHS